MGHKGSRKYFDLAALFEAVETISISQSGFEKNSTILPSDASSLYRHTYTYIYIYSINCRTPRFHIIYIYIYICLWKGSIKASSRTV